MARAILIKKVSKDGLCSMRDFVALGTEYQVRPETITEELFYNKDKGLFHNKEIIYTNEGTYLFVELLKIEKD